MSARVTLEILDGPLQGKKLEVTERDNLLVGRAETCRLALSADRHVSRHHCMLEVNPPRLCIRDMGSRHGTLVNDLPIHTGGEGPWVELSHRDLVQVGQTRFRVSLEAPVVCARCGEERIGSSQVGPAGREGTGMQAQGGDAGLGEGGWRCAKCIEAEAAKQVRRPDIVHCIQCEREVSEEAGPTVRGRYLCLACRRQGTVRPADLIKLAMQQSLEASPEDTLSGSFDDYETGRELGRGRSGMVLEAWRKADRKPFAMKLLLPKAAVETQRRKEFFREIMVASQLQHPNIVALLDHGVAGNGFYFIMELCAGGSLADHAKRRGGRLRLDEAGPLLLQALEGLAYAHEQGFVHRDLKPGNILLSAREGGVARIGDLGLAKSFEQAGLSGFTRDGAIMGTVPFMPHEQVEDFRRVRPVSDVWSMAGTFYTLLTGQYPRESRGKDPLLSVLEDRAVPIAERLPSLPRAVAAVIDRALAFEQKDRYPDARAFQKALAAVL